MADYYLISQLPSLDGVGEALPITQERFLELCDRFLGKKAKCELKKLTLVPPPTTEKSDSALIEAWNEGERNLRLALAKARADKMKKPFEAKEKALPIELVRVANTAVGIESPMEAETFLSDFRLRFLETLRPMDPFCEDFVFYYGLKLKLLLRIRQFDAKLGEAVYKNIYHSILYGDEAEAIS